MKLSFYNFVTGQAQEVDTDRLTHDLARQLVAQDSVTLAAYDAARRAGEPPDEAMSRANLAHSERRLWTR